MEEEEKEEIESNAGRTRGFMCAWASEVHLGIFSKNPTKSFMEGARIFGATGVHGNVPLLSLAIHRHSCIRYSGAGTEVTGTSVTTTKCLSFGAILEQSGHVTDSSPPRSFLRQALLSSTTDKSICAQ